MDLLKILTDRGNANTQTAMAADLERLLRDAQDERATLQTVLAAAQNSAAGIPHVRGSLDEVGRHAATLAQQLETLATRVDSLGDARRHLEALETRIAALEGRAQQAEERVHQVESREAEIDTHREAVQQLVSLADGTLARIDTLKRETAALQQLEERLPRQKEFQPLLDQHVALKTELDQLRAGIAALTGDAETSREVALKAYAHAAKATDAVADLNRKLEPLAQLQARTQDSAAELRTLNGLAEHVSGKVKALENQQQVVDRALVESGRVNTMVWEMEVQINKLNEGAQLATRTEETVARLERLHSEMAAKFEEAARARDEFAHNVARQEHDANALLEGVQGHLDRLGVDRQEMATLSERQRVLQAGIAEGEARMDALSARRQELAQFDERAESLATRMQELTAQAETLQHKQAALNTLEERLDTLETTAKRTHRQFESLAQSRQDLDSVRSEIQAFRATYEQTSTLFDGLRTDKREIEQFLEKAAGFMGQASQIEAHIDTLAAQVTRTEASAARTLAMSDGVDALASRLAAVTPRVQMVDDLEARLNTLNALRTDVDQRMSDQLARRAELESLRVVCDGVAAQVTDAQQKLTAVTAAQAQLAPTMAQISALQAELERARAALGALHRDEETLAAQERRLADFVDASRTLSHDIAQRLETVDRLQNELSKAGAIKVQLVGELAQIQGQQHDTFAQLEAADDRIKQLDTLWKQLEQRRAHLEEAEHKMVQVESRLGDVQRLSDAVDQKMQGIADRAHLVDAVKREVEAIHALDGKRQADLVAIAEGRAEIVQARGEMDRLLGSLAETREKIAAIESRRPLVDEVQRNADTIAHALEDVRITLDSLGEQKALIDHVVGELARLEFTVQDARGTLKALQAERDVAQRIAENVRLIHARALRDAKPPA